MHGELSRDISCKRAARRAGSNRRGGFTLTEVVVASGLLLVAIVPILKGLTTVHLNSTIIEYKTRSLVLARAKLDDIRARSIYSYTSTFTESNTSVDGSYLCNVADSGSGGNIRTITVSVGFDVDGDSTLASDEIEVSLTTLVAKRWGA